MNDEFRRDRAAREAIMHGTNISDIKAGLAISRFHIDFYTDWKNRTVLMTAKTAEETKLFIEAGADVNHQSESGDTALMLAKTPEQTKLLIEAGADVNAKNEDGETALMVAKTPEQTKLLIEAGADVNAKDKDGDTALMLAYTAGQIKLLLEAGADVYAKDKWGRTAFDLANTKEQKEILANVMKKRGIQKRKENIRHTQKVRKEILKRHPEEKVSGVVMADEIARDMISGKEKRTITPEVGREIRRKKALER